MTGRGPNKDQTRPINCSATPGVGSYDQTLSEAVTESTGDTVHRHGSVFSVTGRSRLDDRMHEVHHPIESREVPEWRQRDRTRPIDDDWTQPRVRSARAATVGTTGHVWCGRRQRLISSSKLGFTPNSYFLSGAYK